MNRNMPDMTAQFLNQIDIIPSKLDDVLGKACPCAEDGNKSMSSMWNFFHGIYNARLAQDLKKAFAKLNIQHEVEDGNGRLDIRLVAGYKNKVFLGQKNLAVIDLKTGKVKLFQLCLYSIRSQCPVIIVELLSGDVHLVTLEMASKILANVPNELEKINELRSFNATLPGRDCKICSRTCKDRIADYSPYEVSANTFAEKALKLEINYNKIKEKVQDLIKDLIDEARIKASEEEKESQSMLVSVTSESKRAQIT